jgi:hypothetical protein
MKAPARKVLGAGWQRCRVHFQRNLLARVGKTNKLVVSAVVKTARLGFRRRHQHLTRPITRNIRQRVEDRPRLVKLADHGIVLHRRIAPHGGSGRLQHPPRYAVLISTQN